MRIFPRLSLALLFWAVVTPQAFAASYQLNDGTIVDPIIFECCNSNRPPNLAHPYSGIDLAPGADLQDADLGDADLRDAALAGADLRRATLGGADLRNAKLSNADLRGAGVGTADVRNANLSNVDLRDARIAHARFNDADLSGANLSGSRSFDVDLRGADLTGAVWAYSSLDAALLTGANLSFADLRGSGASDSGGSNVSLVEANLDSSTLAVVFVDSDFTNASLRSVRFRLNDFSGTDLSGSNFTGADLTSASFTDTSSFVLGARKISVLRADFSQALLRNVVGLENTEGAALYDSQTDFTNAWADLDATIPFDPIAAGWTLVPEPGTSTLLLLGLAGLSRVRPSMTRG